MNKKKVNQNQYYNNIDEVINKALSEKVVIKDKNKHEKFLILKSHDIHKELNELLDIESLI